MLFKGKDEDIVKTMEYINIDFDYISEETYDMFSYFDCTDEGINNFLYQKAKELDDNSLGTTHLAIDTDKNRIIGYYTLRNSSLLYSVDNGKTIRGIPSTEIYMFAIDKEYQGLEYNDKYNISDFILKNAIMKISDSSNDISASKFIILNSVDKAINFYKRNGFEEFKDFMQYLDDDKSINIICPNPMYRRTNHS